MIFGEPDRPAVLESPEVGDDRFQQRAGLPVAVADGNLDAGAILVDDQVARVEVEEIELGRDDAQAVERRHFAAAQAAQRMHLGRNVDHVAEIVRQIARQQIEILRPSGIVDVGDDGFRLGHACPLHDRGRQTSMSRDVY